MTVGGDGAYYIWDKNSRKRLKSTQGAGWPITACAMTPNAMLSAIAFGYDWSLGCTKSGEAGTGIYLCPL